MKILVSLILSVAMIGTACAEGTMYFISSSLTKAGLGKVVEHIKLLHNDRPLIDLVLVKPSCCLVADPTKTFYRLYFYNAHAAKQMQPDWTKVQASVWTAWRDDTARIDTSQFVIVDVPNNSTWEAVQSGAGIRNLTAQEIDKLEE